MKGIMFTGGNLDHHNSRESIDSRLINIGRQSVDTQSIVSRQSVNNQAIVGQYSDKLSAECRSIFHRCISIEYRSTAGGISVDCQLNISHMLSPGRNR